MKYYYCKATGLIYRANLATKKVEFMFSATGKWSETSWAIRILDHLGKLSSISPIAVKWFEKDGGYIHYFRDL